MDILDVVEFMALLFDKNVEPKNVGSELLIVVMVWTCIALLVPVVALFDLTRSNFGAADISKSVLIFTRSTLSPFGKWYQRGRSPTGHKG